jgi:hypothetical protein
MVSKLKELWQKAVKLARENMLATLIAVATFLALCVALCGSKSYTQPVVSTSSECAELVSSFTTIMKAEAAKAVDSTKNKNPRLLQLAPTAMLLVCHSPNVAEVSMTTFVKIEEQADSGSKISCGVMNDEFLVRKGKSKIQYWYISENPGRVRPIPCPRDK